MKNKKSYLILASLISLLLACFPFSVYAEETTPNISADSPSSIPYLDSYFTDNYDILPYIESDGSQYINTGIIATNNLDIYMKFNNLDSSVTTNSQGLFGYFTSSNKFSLIHSPTSDQNNFYFYTKSKTFDFNMDPYSLNTFELKNFHLYVNGNDIHTFNEDEFSLGNIYLFAVNPNADAAYFSKYNLYSFSIYDRSANDGEGAYVRYYYPAKSKSGGVIGLYDAVSKTFVTTSGSVPFENPTDDKVLHFQIGDFVTNCLGWIEQILDFAIAEPVILMFMTIGLCGVAIRWARRVVHF